LFEEDTKENFEERRGIGQSVCLAWALGNIDLKAAVIGVTTKFNRAGCHGI
jgi:hypothetical protein